MKKSLMLAVTILLIALGNDDVRGITLLLAIPSAIFYTGMRFDRWLLSRAFVAMAKCGDLSEEERNGLRGIVKIAGSVKQRTPSWLEKYLQKPFEEGVRQSLEESQRRV